jgi:hypothetical protein
VFSNSNTAQQNQLVADVVAAETAREGAVTGSTHENHARLWNCFTKYLAYIGLSQDVFLDSFTRSERNKIIGTFAMAVRQGRFSTKAHDTLASGTVQNTISDISVTYSENGQHHPTKDDNLQLSCILSRQF